jgi:hypothetical protein
VNAANEITAIGGSGAAQPLYDAADNLTGDGTLRYVYDAWQRQTAVRRASDDTPVAAYAFDGLNRRVQKTVFDPATAQPATASDYFFNEQWQVSGWAGLTRGVDAYLP